MFTEKRIGYFINRLMSIDAFEKREPEICPACHRAGKEEISKINRICDKINTTGRIKNMV